MRGSYFTINFSARNFKVLVLMWFGFTAIAVVRTAALIVKSDFHLMKAVDFTGDG
ncbi:hypothetical protein [Lactovum odontotermitis]